MFLDVRPKLQTKPFGEIWVNYCSLLYSKLSWWYKVVNMPLSRYPKQLFQEEWNIKPRPVGNVGMEKSSR